MNTVDASEVGALLDTYLDEGERVRLSFSSIASIEIDNQIMLLRNKGALKRINEDIYTPVGGGVAVPVAERDDFARHFNVAPNDWDRDVVDGSIDMRVMLGRDALAGALEWCMNLSPEVRSPERELREELMDEERLLTEQELSQIALQHLGFYSTLKRWRLPHKQNTTFHLYDVWDATLSAGVEDKLRRSVVDGPVILLEESEINRGIANGWVGSNALALLNWDNQLYIPDSVSPHSTV